MPSIIFHLTEAKLITQHLREASADYPFTHIHGWQNDFTIGSILPDAIPRPLKYKTHFWHPSDFSHVVIAPDLNLWQKTYPNTLKEPMLIGYLAHLHLDYLYFTEYLPSIVRFLNEQGLDETESLKAVSVQIRQTGEQMPVMTFFSKDYFYGDYIRMSPHLIEKYHLSMPASPIHPWPVNETDFASYRQFCKLAAADLSLDIKKEPARIFDPTDFENFVNKAAETFIQQFIR